MAYHIIPTESSNSIICGFTPEKWQIAGKGQISIYSYQRCCLKPSNWRGNGEWRLLGDGKTETRRVECSICGSQANADEMRTVQAEQSAAAA